MTKPFKYATGILGSTETSQKVTADNINQLPPGSVIDNGINGRIIHLHDDIWLFYTGTMWCYDNVERMKTFLDPGAELGHLAPESL